MSAAPHPVSHEVRGLIQPEYGTCAAASSVVLGRFYGRDYPLDYVYERIQQMDHEPGSWLECAGRFFLSQGFSARLVIDNPRVFGKNGHHFGAGMVAHLEQRLAAATDPVQRQNTETMLAFARAGGEVGFNPDAMGLYRALQGGPVLVGGLGYGFIDAQGVRHLFDHPPEGHIALLHGANRHGVEVCDTDDEEPQVPRYTMRWREILKTMREGILTGDCGYLVVRPEER